MRQRTPRVEIDNRLSEERKRIASLWVDGWTAASIAKHLGVSTQAVTQRLALAKKKGEIPKRNRLSNREAAAELNLHPTSLHRLADKLGLKTQEHGRKRSYVLADLQLLRDYLARTCPICSGVVQEERRTHRVYCSEECAKRSKPVVRYASYEVEPHKSDLLSDRLPSAVIDAIHATPEGDVFIPFGEARRLAGITQMQLTYLRLRKIIAVRDNPFEFHKRTKKPTSLYSKAHALAIHHLLVATSDREAEDRLEQVGRLYESDEVAALTETGIDPTT